MPQPANLSLSDLQRLLRTRQRELDRLQKRRDKLERKLNAINDQIAQLGGGANGSHNGRTRPRNSVSLTQAIADVLGKAKGPLKINQIVEGVQSAGYRSTSGNFRSVVNLTLLKNKKQFKNVGRGVYQLKA